MKNLHTVAYALVWLGGINWGLVGLFDLNLVGKVFGSTPMIASLVYIVVGLAAVYTAATHMSDCKVCVVGEKKGKKK